MNVSRVCLFQVAKTEKTSSPQDYVSRMFAPSVIPSPKEIWTRRARIIREACSQKATTGKAINAVLSTPILVINQSRYHRVTKVAAPLLSELARLRGRNFRIAATCEQLEYVSNFKNIW